MQHTSSPMQAKKVAIILAGSIRIIFATTMEQLHTLLKPLANIYCILLAWSLTIINLYLMQKTLKDHASSASLSITPLVLDMMSYYTADEGYQVLSNLGEDGRNAYRLISYADFVFPFLICLSMGLASIALGKGNHHLIAPFVCMVFDYLENVAEKYVLEIFSARNDIVMTLACYFGLVKMFASSVALIILAFSILQWFWRWRKRSLAKQQDQKSNGVFLTIRHHNQRKIDKNPRFRCRFLTQFKSTKDVCI